jgi:Fe-S-cluster-containing hydrogenase component 2
MEVCPKEAIYRDEVLDCVRIDYDLCIGCKMCVAACPFGAMGYNPKRGLVFKCDFCQGEPQCTRFCDTQAIKYVDATNVQRARMRESAKIILGTMAKGIG